MRQRTIGNTGVRVSALGLGCNNFGLRIDTEASRAVIHKALDLGITFWDTADVYGRKGGSETCLGRFLGPRRKDIFLATKFGGAMDEAGTLRGASRAYIMSAVEASLTRLKTDWIDLYQLHHYDPKTPLEETMRALDDLVKQGKVRHIGCSNYPAWRVVDAQWTAKHHGLTPFISCQEEYSALARKVEREMIPAMQAHGIGMLPYLPLAAGLLTGKYKRNVPLTADSRLAPGKRWTAKFITEQNWTLLEALDAFCAARNITLLQLAFGWLLAKPTVASVIAGATKPEQVASNVHAGTTWTPSAEDVAEIDRITAAA